MDQVEPSSITLVHVGCLSAVVSTITSLLGYIGITHYNKSKKKEDSIYKYLSDFDAIVDKINDFISIYHHSKIHDDHLKSEREFLLGRIECLRVNKLFKKASSGIDKFITCTSDLTFETDCQKINYLISQLMISRAVIENKLVKF